MSKTAILDINSNGSSFVVEISEYSTEDGKLIGRKRLGESEEIKQIRLKEKIILTNSIYSYRLSIVLEDFNETILKEGTLIIN
ncbi:MAG: hypothetical protein ACP5I2_03000 [Fervidicoccaceae archaeon]|jgi:hypothetical protein